MRNFKPILTLMLGLFAISGMAQNDSIYHFVLNGKDYEVIKIMKSYEDACSFAAARGAHLVHMDDSLESAGVYDAIINGAAVPSNYTVCNDGGGIAYVWIGATDGLLEGEWLWDGDNDGVGDNFWNGEGSLGDGNGAAVNDAYVNWGGTTEGGYNEPDNYSNQDAAAIALNGWPGGTGNYGIAGEWNDIKTYNELYFVVEYEGNFGVNELLENNSIKIFPNPTSKLLTVDGKSKLQTIELLDVTGSRIALFENINETSFSFDVSKISSGIYFVKVTDYQNNILTRKVIFE